MTDLNNDICSICLDSNSTQLKTCKWTCNHLFHEHCVAMWTNGCPLCRNNKLIKEEEDPISWSISRNPYCPMDISMCIHIHNHVPRNDRKLYQNEWKDRDCINTNHQMYYLEVMRRVITVCSTCVTYQSTDIKHH